jgi:hypothetical protein
MPLGFLFTALLCRSRRRVLFVHLHDAMFLMPRNQFC